ARTGNFSMKSWLALGGAALLLPRPVFCGSSSVFFRSGLRRRSASHAIKRPNRTPRCQAYASLCGKVLGASQEAVIHIACVNIDSSNPIHRIVAKRDCALARACARAGNIERCDTTVGSAQDTVIHIVRIEGSCRDCSCGVKAIDGKNNGALTGTCACVRSIKCSDGAVQSAQEAVTYAIRIN